MAKNNIIARKGTSLNLSTNKSIKTANLYEEGDELNKMKEAVEDLKTAIGNVGAEVQNPSGLEGNLQGVQGRNAPWWSKIDLGNSGEVLGKVGTGLGAATALYGLYNQTANNIDHTKLDAEKAKQAMVPNSVSIGNYDALADWKDSMPSLNMNLTNSDLDNMTGLQKFGSIFSGALTGGAAGWKMSKNPYVTAATTIAGAATGLAGLFKRDSNISDMVSDSNNASRRLQKRVDAMYNHELRDIQEENNNIAMANLSAKGGKINIAPSKRGTFKAQAKRMGMSVQEAARHILAHKDRYSPAMRKKANFARNFAHAYGGELFADGGMFEHPAEYNHGGYFSLDPELIKINQGGTHEQNPLNGVPMGFDENGIPNLVEEGETIFDDYVFSNRLAPTEQQLAEGGLATKYKDHTFADISAKIAKQYEETPNDEISKESMKESMQRLRTIQEQVKEDKEAEEQINAMNDFAMMPPEEQQAAMTQMQQQQQPEMLGAPEEMPAEEPMPEEVPQEVPMGMEAYNNAPIDMMAFGGNLFTPGGDLKEKAHRRAVREVVPIGASESFYEDIIKEKEEQILAELIEEQINEEKTQEARQQKAKQLRKQYPSLVGDIEEETSNNVTSSDTYTESLGASNYEEARAESIRRAREKANEGRGGSKIDGRSTDGVAGTADKRSYNTARYNEGMTAEQKREAWYDSSGKALIDSLNNAKKDWDTRGLKGDELKKEQQAYVNAMNAVQEAYTKAYEAGYDPTTSTSNKNEAVRVLQELWKKNQGNKYFDNLMKSISTKGITGDNSDQGWVDSLWGDITRNRNWGLTEYFGESAPVPDELVSTLKNAGISYTPNYEYGDDGYKAYKFGLLSDREPMGLTPIPEGKSLDGISDQKAGLEMRDIPLTPEQERAKRRALRQAAREERRGTSGDDGLLPTWMRYAPIVGAGISAIWDMAQKPDYSVAEAVSNAARNVPRARFNPIGNYLTYRPVDRNFYLNQVRNQGLANERAVLNASGANQGAATAALLANQYNTQTAIGNSLMQQELANRQNEQQVAQFNRGTDQYNSQGLFNESIYNHRSGMQRAQMGITAAQLRQAERQRRNAAISADLTNLFQGIGDIGWENMNINMANTNKGMLYGRGRNGETYHKAANGGMLTKKKSRRK